MLEPLVVHPGHAVSGIEDHVDECVAWSGSWRASGRRPVGLVPGRGAGLEQALDVAPGGRRCRDPWWTGRCPPDGGRRTRRRRETARWPGSAPPSPRDRTRGRASRPATASGARLMPDSSLGTPSYRMPGRDGCGAGSPRRSPFSVIGRHDQEQRNCSHRRDRRHPSRRAGHGAPLQTLFGQIAEHADVLALCGDLTDYGDPEEARGSWPVHWRRSRFPSWPSWAITTTSAARLARFADILRDAGVQVLDGDAHEVLGVGFAGVKGFAGGFGRRSARALGRGHHQAVRAGGAERGAEAGDRARHGCAPSAASRCCTTRRSQRPSRASRWRSIPFSAAAGWKSRSPATRWTRSFMATRTTARRKAGPWAMSRSTTSR